MWEHTTLTNQGDTAKYDLLNTLKLDTTKIYHYIGIIGDISANDF